MAQYEGETIELAIQKGLADLKIEREEADIQVVREDSHGFLGIGKKTAIVEMQVSPEVIAAKKAKQEVRDRKIQKTIKNDAQQDQQTVSDIKDKVAAEVEVQGQFESASKAVTTVEAPKFERNDNQAIKDLSVYLMDLTKRLGAPALIRVDQQESGIVFHLETAKEGLLIGKHGRSINSLQYLSQTFFNHHGRTRQTIVLDIGDYRERRERALTSLTKRTARNVVADHKAIFLDPMPSFERKLVHTLLAESPYVETFSEGTEPDRYVVIAPRKTVKLP
ncbi:RNA-binding cell elongation regulator Jag/EloR [Lapidilactobacillus bayanensis]|uniref:RNA-binding cell elongation regulator Jag/EloR n=1 Tax=Lapidilactobacillus bayanensis TaxID=2485998 RepID=UPI0013DDCBFE|nr:RNA-binding cell elongation regulator Jag/EloR [Lapidilactobacillus bayanensis]